MGHSLLTGPLGREPLRTKELCPDAGRWSYSHADKPSQTLLRILSAAAAAWPSLV